MRSRKSSIKWYGCPIRFANGIFGDKWTLLIIRDLMFQGKHYYGEFLSDNEPISTNILADRLQKLESSGVISKSQDPENLVKKIYCLTEMGIELLSVMLEIVDWAEKFDEKTEVPKDFIQEYRKNRSAFIKKHKARLKTEHLR